MNNSVLTHRPLIPGLAVTSRHAQAADSSSNRNVLLIAALLLAHIPLGVIVYKFPVLATLHALIVFGIGLRWALMSPTDLYRVGCVGAYIAGSEVLWRMADAQVFWEYGKYSTSALFIVALVRSGRLKGSIPMFLYFALLLPSAVIILLEKGLAEKRGPLSFNMSGPLAFMAAAWFFSNLKLTRHQLERMFLTVIYPLIGVAFLTLFVTVTAEELRFVGQSNKEMSAGFGPNQVSAALGLGFFAALLSLLISERSQLLRVLVLIAMIFMGVQSMMTFSRGGMYNAVGATIIVSLFLLRDGRAAFRMLVVATLIFTLGYFVLLPKMDEFTGGALLTRFQDTDTTNREEYILIEMQAWAENPIFGVGPGEAKEYRDEMMDRPVAAHTEFSRMLAEHGVFGLLALIMLLGAGLRNFFAAQGAQHRALVAGMVAWSLLYMTNAALRLVAPEFLFGLTFIVLVPAAHPAFEKLHRKIVKRRPGAGATRPVPLDALRQSP